LIDTFVARGSAFFGRLAVGGPFISMGIGILPLIVFEPLLLL
jgi:hypothetical protein